MTDTKQLADRVTADLERYFAGEMSLGPVVYDNGDFVSIVSAFYPGEAMGPFGAPGCGRFGWTSLETVSVASARRFAEQVIRACDLLELKNA